MFILNKLLKLNILYIYIYRLSKINKLIVMIKIIMMGGIYFVCVIVYCKFLCDEFLV